MWFSLFLIAFLVAAAYIQAIQGLTSAAIMCVLTVLCMALAFGSYEYVAENYLMGVLPDFAYPIALIGLFVVPLIVFRLLLDKFVPRASLLPHLLDRAAGAAAGICGAVLMTGMLAVGIELIPWGAPGGVLGFCRFDPENPTEQRELWLKPDRTVVHLAGVLSNGTFSGARRFWEIHPDFVTEIGLVTSAPRGVRVAVPRDSVRVVEAGKIDYVYDYDLGRKGSTPTFEPVDPRAAGFEFLHVTLSVSDDTADADEKKRYTPASIRIIGDNHDQSEMYPGIAIANPDDPSRYMRGWKKGNGPDSKHITAGQLFLVPANNQIEVAFEVPKGFEPRFVAYKLGGRAPLSKRDFAQTSFQATTQAASTPTPTPTPAPPPKGGRVSGVRIKFGTSHFGPELPLRLTAYSGSADVRNGVLSEGYIEGLVADQGEVSRGKMIDQFEVPPDKRLLHLNVESLRAGSLAGKVLNYAVRTLENYILEDDRGHKLTPVGKYAIAKVGGREIIELQYNPQVGGRVKPFSRIKPANLKKDYQFVYLYLMDSGAKALRFVPSGGKRPTDLSGENLVAP